MATYGVCKLGGTTIPGVAAGPEGCSSELVGTGATMEMASGAMIVDYTGAGRYRWTVHCTGLLIAQVNTIAALMPPTVITSQSFCPPDEDSETVSHTVYVVPNSFRRVSQEIGTSIPYYSVDFQVEEAS